MTQKKLLILCISLLLASAAFSSLLPWKFLSIQPAAAKTCEDSCSAQKTEAEITACKVGCASFEKSTSTTTATPTTTTLSDPLGNISVATLSGRIIRTVLGLVGSASLLMFVIGGFLWLTSAGNQDRIKKGRDTIVWAALGLLVTFSSYAILKFIFTALESFNG